MLNKERFLLPHPSQHLTTFGKKIIVKKKRNLPYLTFKVHTFRPETFDFWFPNFKSNLPIILSQFKVTPSTFRSFTSPTLRTLFKKTVLHSYTFPTLAPLFQFLPHFLLLFHGYFFSQHFLNLILNLTNQQ
jgi:hypothetical protein